ncbi:MAG TPA: adenine deaminase [Bacteroidales bacterium]|nr:adenine deaminase [Bacteroidales bacterium]
MKKISGNIIDVHKKNIFPAEIFIRDGKIHSIEKRENAAGVFILPGLIDAHIHIESSMLTPGSFAREAVRHGTVATVSDPHEIANVTGIAGVEFMIEDARKVPVKFFFGAPSCVPATSFETSGASLSPEDIKTLLRRDDILYLSEMMNFPGVIYNDSDVLEKLKAAALSGKPVDGHAPGLTGADLQKYVEAGISTDHECSDLNEALEKIKLGMKILIREGSAARNLNALKPLLRSHPQMVMLCSDDLHPEMLRDRHLNKLVSQLIREGYDLFDVLRAVTLNPVSHYSLPVGLLRKGDYADFIIVDNPESMNIIETWIDGHPVFTDGEAKFSYNHGEPVNNFNCSFISTGDILIKNQLKSLRVIEAMEGELLTGELFWNSKDEVIHPDISQDILKIVVKDRYKDSKPATGFIKGFGLKQGAFASSVAHDSHNIVAIGTNDADIVNAVNAITQMRGGLAVSFGNKLNTLKLDVGGIMSTDECNTVADRYQQLSGLVRSFGCTMKAPFMTLSFMSLLVIPSLKIGDRGLFDVTRFTPVSLFL